MTIRTPGAVYRSTKPTEHRAIAEQNAAARAAAVEAMCRLADELVPGSTPYGVHHESGAVYMSGVEVAGIDIAEPPPAMRWDTKARRGARVLVPRKKTDDGKALAARMDALDHKPKSLGSVSTIFAITDGTHRWFSSGVIEVLGDEVYATYFHPLDNTRWGDRPSDRDKVAADPGWVEAPLSEFYAAREAADRA